MNKVTIKKNILTYNFPRKKCLSAKNKRIFYIIQENFLSYLPSE